MMERIRTYKKSSILVPGRSRVWLVQRVREEQGAVSEVVSSPAQVESLLFEHEPTQLVIEDDPFEVEQESDFAINGEPAPVLPISDYDSLNVGTILRLLSDFNAADLGAILEYESRNKGRKTVLKRIEEILGDEAK